MVLCLSSLFINLLCYSYKEGKQNQFFLFKKDFLVTIFQSNNMEQIQLNQEVRQEQRPSAGSLFSSIYFFWCFRCNSFFNFQGGGRVSFGTEVN